MRLKGSKQVVCKCGRQNFLVPGTARPCSGCGKQVKLPTAKTKTKKKGG